jgi:uncharacterized protein
MSPDCCVALPAGPLGAALLLGTGLAVSLGHCVGMCGPLAVAFGMQQRSAGRTRWRLAAPLALYHAGRLSSYAVLGAAAGLLGAIPALAAAGRSARGALSLAAAAVLLASAVGLPFLPRATRRWAWVGRLQALHRRLGVAAGRRGRFGLGVANGFLPCGPVGAIALAAAAAGSPLRAAGAMVLFGLGTFPALALVAAGAGSLAPSARIAFRRTASVLLVLLAFQLSMRGLAALDVVAHREIASWMLW